ncbi:acetyl-CoA carboxylase biotin carboxyl carrier protein [Sphingosinicella sp. LY1275]|uniref:acetyl-CoA carboxylase biotin carboxyl carrier protein n=1 Tax=Sphingosinicella sp. LY1275 TaxID=3095379 RepID=UPI002ADECE7C|nr:acetyl-CoA carboxylase biotin carboxyl carrier protein [Sphingosinicella sp. LY1275]MEA1014697.1 acetyl-CoA carboxylase biotin carboxyl carrier protein [Sphingosinicella sp. LY1275]
MTDNNQADGAMQVDTDLVRQLAEMLTDSDLSEIEVQDGERRIVVKRKLAMAAAPVAYAPAPAAAPAAPAAAAPAADVPAAAHPGAVKSPMVGTVFLAGEPGAKPFVAPGQQVAVGDTLLIVEAMKVMNPITATKAGTVKQVLVQDAQPVEFDQPLVIIE